VAINPSAQRARIVRIVQSARKRESHARIVKPGPSGVNVPIGANVPSGLNVRNARAANAPKQRVRRIPKQLHPHRWNLA
jgi:hypothetical protein